MYFRFTWEPFGSVTKFLSSGFVTVGRSFSCFKTITEEPSASTDATQSAMTPDTRMERMWASFVCFGTPAAESASTTSTFTFSVAALIFDLRDERRRR